MTQEKEKEEDDGAGGGEEKGGDYESSIGISPTRIQEEKPKIRWKVVTSEYRCTVQLEQYIFQTWK